MYDKCSDCEYTNYDNYVQKVENQQKDFIKYLEEEIKIYSKTTYAEEILKELEEILQKYKSTIGVK